MKYKKLFVPFLLIFIQLHSFSQIKIEKPKIRAVYQRNNYNQGNIPIKGRYNNAAIKTARCRLQVINGGQNTDWEQLAVAGHEFSGRISGVGGWYHLEIEVLDINNNVIVLNDHKVGIGEVLVVAGQSNSIGDGGFATDERVIGLNYAGHLEGYDYFIDLTNKTNGKNTIDNKWIGPVPTSRAFVGNLGDKLVRHFQVPILFFSTGASSTNIEAWSNGNALPYLTLKNCLLYQNREYGVRGILWHQGESNSMFTTTNAENHYLALKNLIENCRNDFGFQDLAWNVAIVSWAKFNLAAPDSNDPNSQERRNETRNGQKLTIERIPNVFEGPDSDLIEGYANSPMRKDGVHFTYLGYEHLAELWYQKLLETGYFSKSNPVENTSIPKQKQYLNFPKIENQYLVNKRVALNASSNTGLPIAYKVISGPAYIDGNYLNFTGTKGKIVVEATCIGNSEYYDASEIRVFDVLKMQQSLLFEPIPNVDLNTTEIAAVTSSNSANAIHLQINYGPAFLNNNKIMLNGTAGEVSVTASLPDNQEYEGAAITRVFQVSKIQTNLSVLPIENKYVDNGPISIQTSSNSTQPITIVAEGPCTYENGLLKLTGTKGQVKVMVSQAGNQKYSDASPVVLTFEVIKYSQNLIFEPITAKTVLDTIVNIGATTSANLPLEIKHKSGPAQLTDKTYRLFNEPGTVVYSIAQKGNDLFEEIPEKEYSFKITKVAQRIDFKDISNKKLNDAVFDIFATSTANLPITFEKIYGPFEIINNNQIQLTGQAGEAKIKAIQNGNNIYASADVVEKYFKIEKLDQIITVAKIADVYFDAKPLKIDFKTKSGATPLIAIESGPATFKDSLITLNGSSGTVKVALFTNETEKYLSAKTELIFKVLKKPAQVIFNKITDQIFEFKNFKLAAASNHTQTPIKINILQGSGNIKGDSLIVIKPSFFELELSQDSTNQYESFSTKHRFTIHKIPQFISIDSIPFQFNHYKTIPLKVTHNRKTALQYEVIKGPATFIDSVLHLNGGIGMVEIAISQKENDYYTASNKATRTFLVSLLVPKEANNWEEIQAYPNPFRDEIEILSNKNISNIEVFNQNGQKIKASLKANNNKTLIRMSNYPSGYYWIKYELKNKKIGLIKMLKLDYQ